MCRLFDVAAQEGHRNPNNFISQLSVESVSNVIAVSPRNNICSGCLMYSSFCHTETELCKDFKFSVNIFQTFAKVMIHPT